MLSRRLCAGKTRSGEEATAIGVSGHRGSGCVVRLSSDFPRPPDSIPAPRALRASAVTPRANLFLRQQVIVLRRVVPRPRLQPFDRWLISSLAGRFRALLSVVVIVKTETVIGWNGTGWRLLWRWRSRTRRLPGRPPIDADLRILIRRMRCDNSVSATR